MAKQSIPILCKRLVHREGKSAIASTVTQILNKLYGSCGKRKVHMAKDGTLTSPICFWLSYHNHKYKISARFLQMNHGQPRLTTVTAVVTKMVIK